MHSCRNSYSFVFNFVVFKCFTMATHVSLIILLLIIFQRIYIILLEIVFIPYISSYCVRHYLNVAQTCLVIKICLKFYFLQQIEKAMQGVQRDNQHKRKQLLEMLKICYDTFQKYQRETQENKEDTGTSAIEGFLRTEGIISDLRNDIQQRTGLVERGECVVVVSGKCDFHLQA